MVPDALGAVGLPVWREVMWGVGGYMTSCGPVWQTRHANQSRGVIQCIRHSCPQVYAIMIVDAHVNFVSATGSMGLKYHKPSESVSQVLSQPE